MTTLVTGATGFVGQALVSSFLIKNKTVKALVRSSSSPLPGDVQPIIGDLTGLVGLVSGQKLHNELLSALKGVDVVIHSAARAHVMQEQSADPLEEYRKMNRDATLALARLAVEAGVERFVFLSSIGVNGNHNFKAFTEEHAPAAHDLYAVSKLEAEQGLLQIARETNLEVVIIRPPLVYGPNAPGNFKSLVKWMRKGVPLPFGAIHNKRSLVALDNLVDFIGLCADREKSPKAVNQVFLISDNEDVSTTQLLKKVAKAQNKQAWLIPVPVNLMAFFAKLLGKGELANRLFGSLQVDSSKARELLGWQPVVTMDEQLKKMAKKD